MFVIKGQTLEGEDLNKTVAVQLGPRTGDGKNPAVDARKRLTEAGLAVSGFGEQLQISTVRFGSRAAKARIEQGYDIVSVKVPNERLSAHWFYLPGLAIVVLVWLTQGLRMRKSGSGPDLLERDAHAA